MVLIGVYTVTTVYIETVAKGGGKNLALSYTLCGRKRRKNIKADGKSNLVSLANWLESRVVCPNDPNWF